VPPTPVRLTRRALEGGAGGTLECLLRAYAGSRRDVRAAGLVIPIAVNPVRPSPPLQRHAAHCCNNSGTTGAHMSGTPPCPTLYSVRVHRQRHPRIGPLQQPGGQPLHYDPRSCSCTSTERATTPQLEQELPGHPSTPRHCSPYRYT
jgi:hypothetical protein